MDFKMQCINQLQECASENNGYISLNVYRKSGRRPIYSQIIRAFETWNNALKAAGLPTTEDYKTLCAQSLQSFTSHYPNNPSEEMYEEFLSKNPDNELLNLDALHQSIGSWAVILKQANVWSYAQKVYNHEVCNNYITACAAETNGKITIKAYEAYRERVLKGNLYAVIPSAQMIIALYGSWSKAIKASSASKIAARLMLDHVQNNRQTIQSFQSRREITNPYKLK